MGIKFHCPNGHKLNVKSFLAGKKGVCPHCGAKFRIPVQAADDDEGDDLPAPAPGASVIGGPAVPVGAAVAMPAMPMGAPAAAAGVPVAMPSARPAVPVGAPVGAAVPMAAPAAVPMGAPVGRPTVPVASGVPLPASGVPMGAAVALPAAMPGIPAGVPVASTIPVPQADPIAEAPAAIWYVRPPTGSQYGPARGDVMRKWIAEGRVSSDSLLWREGWADWRNAGQLFPNLTTAGAASPAASPVGNIPSIPRSARTAARYSAKQKGGSGVAIAALVVLGLVCAVLVGVLAYVLSNLK